MSYNFGQFRKTQLDHYSTPMEMTLDYKQNKIDGNTTFYDACGNLFGDNILDNQNSYYLRFGVEGRSDAFQTFSLKIKNDSLEDDNEQFIQEFTAYKSTGTYGFETIISPNATYNQIFWELQRVPIDYSTENSDGTYGRKMKVIIYDFSKLINVLDVLRRSSYPNLRYFNKIGVQGSKNLMMCINREPIRIGSSGIYEINNDIIQINSMSFVPKASSDYFIMDFEY